MNFNGLHGTWGDRRQNGRFTPGFLNNYVNGDDINRVEGG